MSSPRRKSHSPTPKMSAQRTPQQNAPELTEPMLRSILTSDTLIQERKGRRNWLRAYVAPIEHRPDILAMLRSVHKELWLEVTRECRLNEEMVRVGMLRPENFWRASTRWEQLKVFDGRWTEDLIKAVIWNMNGFWCREYMLKVSAAWHVILHLNSNREMVFRDRRR